MRQGKLTILASLAVAAATLLTACGSSSKTTSSSAKVKKETCQQVAAVLSDGPEPEADPVGYAQAQVLPLRQIHTSDEKLHQAIDMLAATYQAFSSSNGASQAKSAVTTASKAIDTICPGATS
jgi:hypothetical protein